MHLYLLAESFVPTKVIRVRNKDKPWFNDDCRLAFDIKQGPISGGLLNALELTGMSLSITRGEPMLYMPRLCISLVSEAGCVRVRVCHICHIVSECQFSVRMF